MKQRGEDTYQLDFAYDSDKNSYERTLCKPVVIAGKEMGVTPVFYAYWWFAAERQKIFFKRLRKTNSTAFTSDPVLSNFKFTNAYRASDRVSQYLIRNVIYRRDLPQYDEEVFFRILLFKFFNKIETWELFEEILGEVTLRNYRFSDIDVALTQKMARGAKIYSAAYIMPSAGSAFGQKAKHQNHLLLLERMLQDRFPEKLRACDSMAQAYELMLSAPSIGPFLAYQYVTDFNYSPLTDFSESEFVVAGPGARDGIAKCFQGLDGVTAEDVIRYMYDNQEQHFQDMSIDFKSLWGRPLQLIDCQNVFCEISKYARVAFPEIEGVADRKRIKQKFAASSALPAPWYPPKWEINSRIEAETYGSESFGSAKASALQPRIS